jgi:hypothetical protein
MIIPEIDHGCSGTEVSSSQTETKCWEARERVITMVGCSTVPDPHLDLTLTLQKPHRADVLLWRVIDFAGFPIHTFAMAF